MSGRETGAYRLTFCALLFAFGAPPLGADGTSRRAFFAAFFFWFLLIPSVDCLASVLGAEEVSFAAGDSISSALRFKMDFGAVLVSEEEVVAFGADLSADFGAAAGFTSALDGATAAFDTEAGVGAAFGAAAGFDWLLMLGASFLDSKSDRSVI